MPERRAGGASQEAASPKTGGPEALTAMVSMGRRSGGRAEAAAHTEPVGRGLNQPSEHKAFRPTGARSRSHGVTTK